MQSDTLQIVRRPHRLVSDDKRVIARYLNFHSPTRTRAICRRILAIPESEVDDLLEDLAGKFSWRHRNLRDMLLRHARFATRHLENIDPRSLTTRRKLLIGAYFTLEYSIEAAALFNPSIVRHPNQADVPEGSVRFLLSLRATGEGHVSSIVFRRGTIGPDGDIALDLPPQYAMTARPVTDKRFSKPWFQEELREIGIEQDSIRAVTDRLGETFGLRELETVLHKLRVGSDQPKGFRKARRTMRWLCHANYEMRFPAETMPSEQVIFPATEYEAHGMEDLRMVRFCETGRCDRYYGTYTAYDGRRAYPMLLETDDFNHLHVATLTGQWARNKGMALFPRKVNGQYIMISRHDGENLFLLRSESLYAWNRVEPLQTPVEPWELVQVGNCGSPLETDAGWILLTHGVGPMREYVISALLLDLDDPAKVIGRLRRPLLAPLEAEREGYVPNVVYSCGSMIHNGWLVVPYAMSDSRTGFATVAVDELVNRLLECGP